MTAEVFTAALLVLMLAVLWCMMKMYLAMMAACKLTALPVQCSEMEEQRRDRGAANWRERAGGRNLQTVKVNLRRGRRARPREHDERMP